MESYSATEIIKMLQKNQFSLIALSDFGRLFNISNRNTLYKKIQRLEKKKIIQRLINGKYLFLLNRTNDYVIANFLYPPSYISLESALSFYGIITGFPYKITSITTRKSQTYSIDNKEFSYSRMMPCLYWGYGKIDGYLIAEKEKALLDYIYFSLKGLRRLDWEEFDLHEIDKSKINTYAGRYPDKRLSLVAKSIKI